MTLRELKVELLAIASESESAAELIGAIEELARDWRQEQGQTSVAVETPTRVA